MPNNEWGDFQTPLSLAGSVVKSLPAEKWARVLEPTCGVGSFLDASRGLVAVEERIGIEINAEYVESAASAGFNVLHRNIFDLDLAKDLPWQSDGPLLVLGNPPWVTNAQLGSLGSINLPTKSNIRSLAGFDALTGASNFDIAEFIFLKLMLELQAEAPTIAMLMKTHVARNILSYAAQLGLPYSDFTIREIDAKAFFGAAVDACLFTVRYSLNPEYICNVYPSIESVGQSHQIGVVNDRLVADTERYERTSYADGSCPLEWRSGVKHDASAVMEMTAEKRCDLGLEEQYVLPLLKCTDVFRGRLGPARFMVVPQRRFGEDTAHLERDAPALWSYLMANAEVLDGRRSSIYRGQPRFTVFGLGEYTFARYKIAISGLHKEVRFILVGQHDERPIVFDDTCYMLAFDDGVEAAMCFALLTSKGAEDLLASLIFWDAKRPINKKLLQRLDLLAIARKARVSDLEESASAAARRLGLAEPPAWSAVLEGLMESWENPAPKVRKRRSVKPTEAGELVGLF